MLSLTRKHLGLMVRALLWVIPLFLACRREEHKNTIITGRVTEYGSNEPLSGARIYLNSDQGVFLGSSGSTIDSVLLTDLNGEFYLEYDAQTLKGSAYLTPYHPDYWAGDEYELLTIDQQLDVKLYAKSWFKLRTVPDLGQWPSLSFGGSLRPATVYALEGVNEQVFLVQGGTEIKVHTGFNGTLISSDTIYIQPHDTTTLTLHY